MSALVPTVKAKRAAEEPESVRPRAIVRPSDSITDWVAVTADKVVAAITPVAIA
jgi:hypothetical protein